MQWGPVVLYGNDCPSTNSSQHQIEIESMWCRQCGRDFSEDTNIINEEVYTIHGFNVGPYFIGVRKNYNEGEPYRVEFNWEKVQGSKTLVAFWHTHPNMAAVPSITDLSTMSQWAIQEGKVIPCLIEGNDGLVNWLINENQMAVRTFVTKIGPFFIGKRK